MKIYEETEAVDFIRNNISDKNVSDENILDVIDAIFDYYDDNGELDFDFDDDYSDDLNGCDNGVLIETVTASLKATDLTVETIHEIINAELAYENSLL